jgi:3-deoxy-manno-octulosonate cytidylyltransferase (CMP-KDO synthetase)
LRVLGIIPARYNSSRFPGKPLVEIKGKTMIRRVYEQAVQSSLLDKVIVATDDQRIYDQITSIGGEAMITSSGHSNGTERCNEVAHREPDYDYYINIQGDEPYIHPIQIDLVAKLLDGKTELATLVKSIDQPADLDDPGEMKVVFNHNKEALYFSRSCIPHLRNIPADSRLDNHTFYKHIGIYGYRKDILAEIATLPSTKLETAEKLEQLRWMEHGYRIKVGITTLDSQMVDTPADLEKLKYFE